LTPSPKDKNKKTKKKANTKHTKKVKKRKQNAFTCTMFPRSYQSTKYHSLWEMVDKKLRFKGQVKAYAPRPKL
jgi:hypothetical protein